MNHQITFRQYRAMDLALFSTLLCVCEALITLGATRWFPAEPWTLSLTPAVTAVVMVRWGGFAAIPAVLGANIISLGDAAAAGVDPWMIPGYVLGAVAAAIVGYFAIRLVNLLADKGKFGSFAYYCWGVGLAAIAATLLFL